MSRAIASWLLLGVVATAALVAGLFFGARSTAPDPPAPMAATGLLGVALPDSEGKEQRVDQWRGKVVVVNFWATWCAPCREEMPEFIKAQNDFGAQGLQMVGIAIDSAEKVRPFAGEIGLNYPTLIGGFGAMELSRTLGNGVMALPFTVVLDRKGAIAHTQLGVLKPEKLAGLMRELM